jgi:hypothetical protein
MRGGWFLTKPQQGKFQMTKRTTDSPSTATSLCAPTLITEAVFLSLLDEVNQRLTNAEATNAILVAEVDALAAEVAQLRASA